MRKELAKFLVRLADKIYPEKVARIPAIENYKASKIGLAIVISTNEIKKYSKEKMISYSEASKALIADAKDKVKEAIWLRIIKDSMVETKVSFTKDGTEVSGCLKVYDKENAGRKKSMP